MSDSLKILIADDDPDIVTLVKNRLAVNGFEVITAVDGEEALKQVEENQPDLIIADIMMPKLSGWQFSQMIKDKYKDRKIPIIFLSAMIKEDGQSEDQEIGDFLMQKPFDADKLLEKINELLSQE